MPVSCRRVRTFVYKTSTAEHTAWHHTSTWMSNWHALLAQCHSTHFQAWMCACVCESYRGWWWDGVRPLPPLSHIFFYSTLIQFLNCKSTASTYTDTHKFTSCIKQNVTPVSVECQVGHIHTHTHTHTNSVHSLYSPLISFINQKCGTNWRAHFKANMTHLQTMLFTNIMHTLMYRE